MRLSDMRMVPELDVVALFLWQAITSVGAMASEGD